MTSYECLQVERIGHVVVVTFDRPPVNALPLAGMAEIQHVFDSFADDREVRAAVFAAAGDRAFMAGIDLREAPPPIEEVPPTRLLDRGRAIRDAMWAITDCAVPVIAAVNGPAIGAGLAFAAVCDIIVAAEGATFATTEINVGLLGASSHLSLLVGRHKARELFFLGDPITAEELHRLGAVREVVPLPALRDTAVALAQRLAEKSPIALRLAKEAMNRVEFLPLHDAYRLEQDYTNRLLTYDDAREARRATLEKRPPDWQWH